MRGRDIAYNPVFYSYVLINYKFGEDHNVSSYSGVIYILEKKVTEPIKKYLKEI